MKQTNNAIKFLLAQYRAVYKHALLKNMLSGSILALGLAAGAAQAEDAFSNLSGDYFVVGADTPEDTQNIWNINVEGTQSSPKINNNNISITIVNNTKTGEDHSTREDQVNAFKGKVETNAKIIVDHTAKNLSQETPNASFSVWGYKENGTTVTFKTVEVKNGNASIHTKNNDTSITISGDSQLIANSIDIGNGLSDPNKSTAVFTVQADHSSGEHNAILGRETTTETSGSLITVKQNGALVLQGQSGSGDAFVKGQSLTVSNNGLVVTKGDSFIETDLFMIESDGNFVASGADTISSHSGSLQGKLLVSSSGNLTIQPESKTVMGQYTVKNGAVVQLDGTLTAKASGNDLEGILYFEDDAKLYATTASTGNDVSGSLVINGGVTQGILSTPSSTSAYVDMNKSTLDTFLKGGTTFSGLEYADTNKKVTVSNKTSVKGGIVLTSGGLLNIRSADKVELADYVYKSGDGTSGESGSITVSSGIIKADKLSIKDQLKGSNGSEANVSLHLQSNDLYLGSSAYDNTNAITFASAKAKNLYVAAKNGEAFNLKSNVTLSSTRDVTLGDSPITVGESGIIEGDMVLSGTSGKLIVDGGIYTASDDITIASGSLSVQNTKDANISSLTLGSALKVDTNSGGTVVVNGKLNGAYADNSQNDNLTILDLSNGIEYLNKADNTKKTLTLTAESGGIIKLDASSVQEAIDHAEKLTNTNIIGKFVANTGGVIDIQGDISLDFTATNAQAVNSIFYGGKPKADPCSQTLNDFGTIRTNSMAISMNVPNATNAKLDPTGIYEANSFTLRAHNNDTNLESMTIQKGYYHVGSSLSSPNNQLILESKQDEEEYRIKIALGYVEKIHPDWSRNPYYIGKSGGVVDINNVVLKKHATLQVDSGVWNAQNIELADASGSLSIGGKYYDIKDNAITATLNGQKLTSSAGSLTITDHGTASFKSLAMTGGAFAISGKLDISGTDTADEDGKYGISLGGGTITVQNGGSLDFSTDAAAKEVAKLDGEAWTVQSGTTLKIEHNGEIRLNYASGTSFTADQLASLKTSLFGSTGSMNGFLNVGNANIGLDLDKDSNGNTFVSWEDYKGFSGIKQNEGITTNGLTTAIVKGITSNAEIKGSVGSLQTDATNSSNLINVVGDTALNNALANNNNFAGNSKGEAISLKVSNASDLTLAGSGKALDISLDKDSTLYTKGKGEISLKSISGKSGTASIDSVLSVSEGIELNELYSAPGSKISTQSITTYSEAEIQGDLVVEKKADFGANTYLAGTNEFKSGLTISGDAGFFGNTTVSSGDTILKSSTEIGENALLTTKNLTVQGELSVGEDKYKDNEGNLQSGSTGYLQVDGVLNLKDGYLVIDPEYGQNTSIAAVRSFSETKNVEDIAVGGKITGNVIIAQNAALMVGENASVKAMQEFITRYQNGGSLVNPLENEDGVGAVLALNSKVILESGDRVIIDPTLSKGQILGNKDQGVEDYQAEINKADSRYKGKISASSTSQDADLFLGQGSVFFINDSVLTDRKSTVNGAMHFNKTGAAIKGETGSKIVLGNTFVDYNGNVVLFTDNDAQGKEGVHILDNDIRVESLNGLMYFTLKADGTEQTGGQLRLDTSKIDTAFTQASDPSRKTLLQVASKTINFEEYYDDQGQVKAQVKQIHVVGDEASKSIAYLDEKGEIVVSNPKYDKNQFIAQDGKVYFKAVNKYLDEITRIGTGVEADQAGRLSAFAGAFDAAFAVNQASAEIIASRTGMGANHSAISYADNGQGAGLFVAPFYKNYETEGFKAQGINYGVDMDLYGIALGGDYTMANGLRMGLMFNVGSGDADGQQTAKGTKNDFDFYGVSAYAGFSQDKLSVVADLGYSVIDNDVSASNSIDKLHAKFDSTALTLGVTGQYALSSGGMDIVPHAGLRFTRIDFDDYGVYGEKIDEIGANKSTSLNIFSIPVGVTISKEIIAGSWTVKPSFDFTVTGHFGDDSLDNTMEWAEYSNVSTTYSSEVLDSFTYGATLGVAAKSGNFSLGLGANYTGSSNTDEFGLNANARFVF